MIKKNIILDFLLICTNIKRCYTKTKDYICLYKQLFLLRNKYVNAIFGMFDNVDAGKVSFNVEYEGTKYKLSRKIVIKKSHTIQYIKKHLCLYMKDPDIHLVTSDLKKMVKYGFLEKKRSILYIFERMGYSL